ncbi:MAG: hypothetical protein VB138_06580 [Burkholderia sp.]
MQVSFLNEVIVYCLVDVGLFFIFFISFMTRLLSMFSVEFRKTVGTGLIAFEAGKTCFPFVASRCDRENLRDDRSPGDDGFAPCPSARLSQERRHFVSAPFIPASVVAPPRAIAQPLLVEVVDATG